MPRASVRFDALAAANLAVDDVEAAFAEALRGLRVLDMFVNALPDLWPLTGVGALWRLNVSRDRVTGLAPLREHARLVRLRVADNRIARVDARGHMTRLRWVWLDATPLSPTFESPWPEIWTGLRASVLEQRASEN